MIEMKTKKSNNFIKIPEGYFGLTEIKGINYGHVCLLSKIESLSIKDGKCTASNAYFANLLHTTERTIQRMLEDFRKHNPPIIKTHEDKEGLRTTTRYIYVQHDNLKSILGHDNIETSLQEGHDKNGKSTRQNVSEDMTDLVEGHDNIGKTTRQDCHPNKRLKEKKKDNKRVNREIEAYASNESSLFANASVTKSEFKYGEFDFPEVDKADEVITLFRKGYKYKSDNPQIQKATGLNGKQIHKIIFEYINSASDSNGIGKNKSKDDMSDRIPLVGGGLSVFRYSSIDISFKDLDIGNEDDKETCIHVFNLYTDPNGEYKFDYHSLKSYLKERYNFNITGKFKPQKIDYEGIAAYQKTNPKPDAVDYIDSLTDEIFDINTIGVDVDLVNKLYADDLENPNIPF